MTKPHYILLGTSDFWRESDLLIGKFDNVPAALNEAEAKMTDILQDHDINEIASQSLSTKSKNTGFTLFKIEKNRPSQYMMVEYDPKSKHALVQN